MYRSSEVISGLFTRVGWQQPTQSGYDILTGDNLVSLSGRFFGDFHSLLTIKNIKETIEDKDISSVNFNAWLIQKQKACINRVLQGVFNRDQIIEQLQLFSREYNQTKRLLTNESKFVGYKIELADNSSYSVVLNSVSLTFDSVSTFNLYCFHTAKGKIWEKSVTTVAGVETIVNITDLVLSISNNTYKQGEFIFGYFQDDLGSSKAINFDSCEYNEACIFSAEGCEAIAIGSTDIQTIDTVETNLNYGINLELTSVRDFTAVIVRNPSQFDEAVGLQMACDLIEQIIFSSRSNATERIQKEQVQAAYTDLNQDMPVDGAPYSAGLKNRLKRELQRLNKNYFPKEPIKIVQS
jgi:hypothetical protein